MGRKEGDLRTVGQARCPGGDGLEVLAADALLVYLAQDRLEQEADRERQPVELRQAGLLAGRPRRRRSNRDASIIHPTGGRWPLGPKRARVQAARKAAPLLSAASSARPLGRLTRGTFRRMAKVTTRGRKNGALRPPTPEPGETAPAAGPGAPQAGLEGPLEDVLHSLVTQAVALLKGDGGGFYVADPVRRTLRCVVATGTPATVLGTVLQYGEGAAGNVAEAGTPVRVDG